MLENEKISNAEIESRSNSNLTISNVIQSQSFPLDLRFAYWGGTAQTTSGDQNFVIRDTNADHVDYAALELELPPGRYRLSVAGQTEAPQHIAFRIVESVEGGRYEHWLRIEIDESAAPDFESALSFEVYSGLSCVLWVYPALDGYPGPAPNAQSSVRLTRIDIRSETQ